MKKMLLTALCFSALGFSSCDNDDNSSGPLPSPGTLETDVQSLTFTCGNYYTQQIKVSAENVEWKAAGDAEWIEVEEIREPGSLDGVVTVSVKKNTGPQRSGSIILSGKGFAPVAVGVEQKEAFVSDLIGEWTPSYVERTDPETGSVSKLYLQIVPTWKDPENIPQMDASFILGLPAGTWMLPVSLVMDMAVGMVNPMVSNGLSVLNLRDDGTLGARYRSMSFSEDGVLSDLLNGTMIWSDEQLFPDEETLKVVPFDAVSYYTEGGKLFLSVSKRLLAALSPAEEGGDLCAQIDAWNAQYQLGIVSTAESYSLPLKYTKAGDGTLTVGIDRAMMMPFLPLLVELASSLMPSDPEATGGIDLSGMLPEILNAIFDNTTELTISIKLTTKA